MKPKHIVVIRKSSQEDVHVLNYLRASSANISDVHSVEALSIKQISSTGIIRCELAGIELEGFDAIIYLGTPCIYRSRYAPSREELYAQQEWEQALLAALSSAQKPRIINRSYVFSGNRLLFDPSHQVRILAELGWQTPTSVWHYDFDSDASRHSLYPNSAYAEQHYLMLSLTQAVVLPLFKPIVATTQELVAATQSYMRTTALDWCTIPFTEHAEHWITYGLQPALPRQVPVNAVVKFIDSVLNK